ncbi:MAG: helix-turn-helix transcriptional regulator [Planctomycetota bacterium]|nr:helix-turn-helix transcriptional regulator [Planctomycetota bacterium]
MANQFTKTLETLRKVKGWTIQRAADEAGISKVYYWEIEKDQKKSPSIETVIGLAKAFGVSMDELTGMKPVVKCERCGGNGYHEREEVAA